jgi:hypothetical protein
MFRQYRSKSWQWHTPELRAAVNIPEAVAMEKAVSLLPEKHREAIRWCYVFAGGPVAIMARRLAVTKEGLMELIHSLVNSGQTLAWGLLLNHPQGPHSYTQLRRQLASVSLAAPATTTQEVPNPFGFFKVAFH